MASRCLIIVAAPKEYDAIHRGLCGALDSAAPTLRWTARPITDRFDLVLSGVGKANAAAAVARALDPVRHDRVLNLGVAGALPGSGQKIGDVIEATRCVYADEGSQNPPPDGFVTIAQMGFGPLADICGPGSGIDGNAIDCAPMIDHALSVIRVAHGPIATVSTCSGTDALAAEIVRRTGALAEDMESAAIGFTVARLAPAVRFSTLRVISNSTGDRFNQTWDLGTALARLAELAAALQRSPPR